jgi:exosortase H (IPTLxxWG-CTERM-specific)
MEIPYHRKALLKFCVSFVVLAATLYTLINWLPAPLLKQPLNEYTAAMTGFIFRLFGQEVTVNGVFLSVGGFSAKIITECTAVYLVILFSSFVLAYPADGRKKLIGLLFGIPFLFAVNMLRLLFIFVAGMNNRTIFEYSHVYIGQILMVFFVLLACMVWLRMVVSLDTKDSPLGFLVRFIAWSSLPFALWLYLDRGYVLLNLYGVKVLLGLFGYAVIIPEELRLFPNTFNTFNLIAFSSIVLATRSLGRRKKLRVLLFGLALLVGTNFLFRVLEALFLRHHVAFAFQPFIALIIINQWVLPFAFWLYAVRKEIFRKKGILICPLCGKEKVGIMEHIRAKHGEAALKRSDVRAILGGDERAPKKAPPTPSPAYSKP